MERLVDEGWQLEKWRYYWWLVGLVWMEVRKPDLKCIISSSSFIISNLFNQFCTQ